MKKKKFKLGMKNEILIKFIDQNNILPLLLTILPLFVLNVKKFTQPHSAGGSQASFICINLLWSNLDALEQSYKRTAIHQPLSSERWDQQSLQPTSSSMRYCITNEFYSCTWCPPSLPFLKRNFDVVVRDNHTCAGKILLA